MDPNQVPDTSNQPQAAQSAVPPQPTTYDQPVVAQSAVSQSASSAKKYLIFIVAVVVLLAIGSSVLVYALLQKVQDANTASTTDSSTSSSSQSSTSGNSALSRVQAKARDTERKVDITAFATQLEVYYNNVGMYPAQDLITEQSLIKLMPSMSEDVLYAPLNKTFSWRVATTTGAQVPTKDTYIYQAFAADGKLCTGSADCVQYVLWYLKEYDQTIVKKESLN